MAKPYYQHLDPSRDYCEGETKSVEMDPLRLLRDLSEALYLVNRSTHIAGENDPGYRETRVRLEFVAQKLEELINDYANSLRPDRTKIMVQWVEELGDAGDEFRDLHADGNEQGEVE